MRRREQILIVLILLATTYGISRYFGVDLFAVGKDLAFACLNLVQEMWHSVSNLFKLT